MCSSDLSFFSTPFVAVGLEAYLIGWLFLLLSDGLLTSASLVILLLLYFSFWPCHMSFASSYFMAACFFPTCVLCNHFLFLKICNFLAVFLCHLRFVIIWNQTPIFPNPNRAFQMFCLNPVVLLKTPFCIPPQLKEPFYRLWGLYDHCLPPCIGVYCMSAFPPMKEKLPALNST